MAKIEVHSHALKHGLSEDDVRYAWEHFVIKRPRDVDYWVAIGFDARGREIELVAVECANATFLIIHAMSPATKSIKQELGYGRGQKYGIRTQKRRRFNR